MHRRFLVGFFVFVLVFFAWFRWRVGPPSGVGDVESAIQTTSQSNNALILSRIAKFERISTNSIAPAESSISEVEGVTNTYIFSSNHVVTRIVTPNPESKIFGTPEYESLAKNLFDSLTVNSRYIVDTNLYELKEVFEDLPSAISSGFLYSGIYQVAITTCTLREVRQAIFNTRYRAIRELDEANSIKNLAERDSKIQQIMEIAGAQLELYKSIQQEALEDGRQNLNKLYGEVPKSIFQRLLSIELRQPMGRLEYP